MRQKWSKLQPKYAINFAIVFCHNSGVQSFGFVDEPDERNMRSRDSIEGLVPSIGTLLDWIRILQAVQVVTSSC